MVLHIHFAIHCKKSGRPQPASAVLDTFVAVGRFVFVCREQTSFIPPLFPFLYAFLGTRIMICCIFTVIYTSDIARSFSSCSSASVAFIFSFENASAFRPPTIDHCPSLHVQGKEYMRPGFTPYSLPSERTPIETYSPCAVPQNHDRMCVTAARAADNADDALRAEMIAAPRFWMSSMNSPLRYLSSLITERTGLPLMVALLTSGYWVDEWFPQIITFCTSRTLHPAFSASCPRARWWSSRVIAVKFVLGTFGAKWLMTSALVLAGLPTTRTLIFGLAFFSTASPMVLKMPMFFSINSLRSIPCFLGNAPSSTAQSAPENALPTSEVATTPYTRG
mmetsp:Transcript_11211/g.27414  ORF Transcript_11211/g.27414 Transcript_11211/m.27414 type:complete len:335 (-) Transcript_11211:355-1359(-)